MAFYPERAFVLAMEILSSTLTPPSVFLSLFCSFLSSLCFLRLRGEAFSQPLYVPPLPRAPTI